MASQDNRIETTDVPTQADFKLAKKLVKEDPGETVPPTGILLEQEKSAPGFGAATETTPGCGCK